MLDFKYISLEMLLADCFYGTNLFKVVAEEGFFFFLAPKSFEGNVERALSSIGCVQGA